MRIGILFHNKAGLPVPVAIRIAVRQFEAADHCRGQRPAEAHFNPLELPETTSIDGLEILPDPQVRPNHIRVTTPDGLFSF